MTPDQFEHLMNVLRDIQVSVLIGVLAWIIVTIIHRV